MSMDPRIAKWEDEVNVVSGSKWQVYDVNDPGEGILVTEIVSDADGPILVMYEDVVPPEVSHDDVREKAVFIATAPEREVEMLIYMAEQNRQLREATIKLAKISEMMHPGYWSTLDPRREAINAVIDNGRTEWKGGDPFVGV